MREINVKYTLSDEDEKRLKVIAEGYKKKGYDLSEEKVFEAIMCGGCKYDIDAKFKYHENLLEVISHE